ncbi:MAG: TetR/AcrR family transcriptional regulator [Myxococcaceae bacterium]|nr:TetR/AcrR family transcriptional regulator [Myxococcaceae bacterium]
MGRPRGTRNDDYGERRLAIARSVRPLLTREDGVRASMRQLASAAGVSMATLRHYFPGRAEVVAAVMETWLADGAPHLARASLPTSKSVRRSLRTFLDNLCEGWLRFGVGAAHATMFAEALSSRALGPAFVNTMLEPLLQSGEALLRHHVERGELQPCDLRHAALTLLSPVVLALFHQDSLLGARCRPLDVTALVPAHVDRFLAAFPPVAA